MILLFSVFLHYSVPRPTEIGSNLWKSKYSNLYHGCSKPTPEFSNAPHTTRPQRFLVIATTGGLDRQRFAIVDAVAVARILNATLVVPKLDHKSFWNDSSNFSDIYDVDWFISSLSKDVKILKELPPRKGEVVSPYQTHVPRKCTPACYQKRVLPLFKKKQVVQLSKFESRLANELDSDLQKLRCRVNYHALRFTKPILNMGRQLVKRMRARSTHFIALHLRFETNVLAFSGCYYGGGEKQNKELDAIRKRWKTLHTGNPDRARRQGRCLLTPEEVGLTLRALGFERDTHIYMASGEVYGGEESLSRLRAIFPLLDSKNTLSREDELSPFSSFALRMGAVDFVVCDESDVLVTNNNGNTAKILAGRRRYFGHKPTIRPNAKILSSLFMNRPNMTWEAFASEVRTHQRGYMGEAMEVRPGRGEFVENPAVCICETREGQLSIEKPEPVEDQLVEDDTEVDYVGPQDKELANSLDYNLFLRDEEQPSIENMLSD
ncbi:O-fucosyltransferase 6 [Ranunculus cassubicifolius]